MKILISTIAKKGLAITMAALMALITATAVLSGCAEAGADSGGGKTQKETFDENGFSTSTGLHKDTGTLYNPEGYNQAGYDAEGYNVNGFNAQGYDRDGFDVDGYDVDGWHGETGLNKLTGTIYDTEGYNKAGYNEKGFNKTGMHENGTLYDEEGFDMNGFDIDGYNELGYNAKGFDRTGTHENGTLYDNQGYNVNGFNENGFDRNGKHENGTLYNDEGYNVNGYDKNGFDIDGTHENGTLYDNQGYNVNGFDADGYDRDGLNPDGFYKLNPIAKANLAPNYMMNNQAGAHLAMTSGKTALENQATAVATQFNEHCTNDALKTSVIAACEYIPGSVSDGDRITGRGLEGTAQYIVALTNMLPADKRERFALLLDTYRVQAYVDSRAHAGMNPSIAELGGLYTELGIPHGTINQFFNDVVIPDLSVELNVNPGLIKTLLNQVSSYEQFYSLVDDAKAQGLEPVMASGGSYNQSLNVRNLEDTQWIIQKEMDKQQGH